jgi:lipopolysaccharide biosynthesis glycosyltransferase
MPSAAGGSSVPACRDPVVVLAADDQFAMPLAVTVRSALDNLSSDRKLRIYVLDGGIEEATKEKLVQSWPRGRFDVEWIRVDAAALAGLPISGHVNVVAYYRILIPRVLPAVVDRVIYLDSDMIVLADLARLWDCELAGHWCLAAQDCAAPYLDAAGAWDNFARCGHHLGSAQPVPNFRELGLRADAAYFNSGVMLIDLTAWRNADLPGQLIACLERHRQHARWWDQYALNVVLADRWGQLDLRWNQGSQIFRYPSWQQSPFDRRTFEQLRGDPYIVHYTTRAKPWNPVCRHPLRGVFFEYVDRTAWAGWRPSRIQRLKVIFELFKSSERRLRHGRKWLRNQARTWLRRRREQSTSPR